MPKNNAFFCCIPVMPALTGQFLHPMHRPIIIRVPPLVPDQILPPQSYPWHDRMTQSMIPPLDVEMDAKFVLSCCRRKRLQSTAVRSSSRESLGKVKRKKTRSKGVVQIASITPLKAPSCATLDASEPCFARFMQVYPRRTQAMPSRTSW